jgi:hypothetical protein
VAAVAMGTLYSEGGFTQEQSRHGVGEMGALLDVHGDQQFRFGMAVLASEWRKDVAEDLAMRFVDKNVKKGEKYQYIVRPAEFDSTGVMKMQIRTHYNNMDAYITNNKLAKYNNEDEFADALEKKLQTSVTNIKLERSNTRVTESYDLEYTPVSSGDFIYLNAIMFPDFTSNPFKSIERKLPIEFSHPQISRIDYLIKIPDGYTVAEMPKSTALSACNGGLDIKFIATQKNGTIQISYTANTRRIIYPSEEYANISTFFAKMVELAKQQIVLKRQPQQQ